MAVAVAFAVVALLVAGCGSAGSTGPAPETPPSGSAPASTVPGTPTAGQIGDGVSTSRPPSPSASRPAGSPGGGGTPGGRWRPRAGESWHWQLSGPIDVSVDAAVFDLDLFETPAATVRALHDRGRRVICYLNAGAAEDYRPDHDDFPAAVLGAGNGWAGEKWLDIRRIDVIEPIMAKRMDLCRQKGFDGVEPDLLEAYTNDSGFPVTGADQLRYNRMIARLAHQRGLAVGLKNDLEQVPQLLDDFDFAVNEQCFEYDECAALTPFIRAGKPVFHVEYDLTTGEFCSRAKGLGFSSQRKKLELGAWRQVC